MRLPPTASVIASAIQSAFVIGVDPVAVLFPGGLASDAKLPTDIRPRVALVAEEPDHLRLLGVEGVVGALPVAAELAKVIEQGLIHRNSLASADG